MPPPSSPIGDDDPPDDDCKVRLSDFQIKKKLEIDAHEVKKDELGRKAKISRFELCLCKDGRIVIRERMCKGPIIETGYRMR